MRPLQARHNTASSMMLALVLGLALFAAPAGAQTPPPTLNAAWFDTTFGLTPTTNTFVPSPIFTPAPTDASSPFNPYVWWGPAAFGPTAAVTTRPTAPGAPGTPAAPAGGAVPQAAAVTPVPTPARVTPAPVTAAPVTPAPVAVAPVTPAPIMAVPTVAPAGAGASAAVVVPVPIVAVTTAATPAPTAPPTVSSTAPAATAAPAATPPPPAPTPPPVAAVDSAGPFYQIVWMAHNGTLAPSTVKGNYSTVLTLNDVQRSAPFALMGSSPRLLVGDYPASRLFNTSRWFSGVPAVVVAAPLDTAQANRSAWVMTLSAPRYNDSAGAATLTLLASPVTPGSPEAAASVRKGGLAEAYLGNRSAGVSAVGAWPALGPQPLFLSNITVFLEVACDGLPRPAGGTCVAPSAANATAAAPSDARVATAAAAGSALVIAAGAALDACAGGCGE